MAAGEPHRSSSTRARRNLAAVIGVGMLALACGDGGGSGDEAAPLEAGASTSTAQTALPSCREVGDTVVFSVFGAATTGADGEAASWVRDAGNEPTPRPGAPEVVAAYREAGYQVLYVTLVPGDSTVDGRPLVDAVTVWLGLNGFPVGDGVRVWAPDGGADPSIALIEELTRIGASGAEVAAAYAGDAATVFPLVSGGVANDRVYSLGTAQGTEVTGSDVTSTPLPDAELTAHVADIQALEPICQ